MPFLLVPFLIKAATVVGTALTAKNIYDTGKNIIDAIDITDKAEAELAKAKESLNSSKQDYKKVMKNLISLKERTLEDLAGLDTNWKSDSLVPQIGNLVKRELSKVLDEFNVAKEHRTDIVKLEDVAVTGGIGTVATALAPKVVKCTLEEIAIQIGKTSTGKAIATLTGVAQRNAIYAWLGGGAKTAGGMGVAGGQSLVGGLSTASIFSIATSAVSILSNQILNGAKQRAQELYLETQEIVIKAELVRKEYLGKNKAYEHLSKYFNKANMLRFSNPDRAKTILIGVIHHLEFIIPFEHFSIYGDAFRKKINNKIEEIMRRLANEFSRGSLQAAYSC